MPRPSILPDKNTLMHWMDEGLTHKQMAELVYETTGERVTRSAITMALGRYGLTDPGHRHSDVIPWRLSMMHMQAYPVRMLRLLARQRRGDDLSASDEKRLIAWMDQLQEHDAVVAYDPDSPEGFVYVPREPGDPDDIPIRVRRVWLNP